MTQSITLTIYEAMLLYSALVVFETESEQALAADGFIGTEPYYTDNYLTVIEMVENARLMKQRLQQQYHITQ